MAISRWASVACMLLAVAVVLGAFGAHGLKNVLSTEALKIYQTAAFYHFVHALALLLMTLLANQALLDVSTLQKIACLLVGGMILFSGSLYLLAVTDIKWLGAITPIGGTAFIIAWLWASIALWRTP